MGRAEGVVHVEVGEAREGGSEGGVVPLLAGVEAEVLEEQAVPGPRARDRRLGRGADAIGDEGDGAAENLPEALRRRCEGLPRVGLPLGPAEVAAKDRDRGGVEDRPHGRQARRDAPVVGDGAVRGQRDVVVDPHEDPLPREGQVVEGPAVEGHPGDQPIIARRARRSATREE